MLGNSQFYHRTIRKMVVVFGTMFNDIELVRYTQSGDAKEKMKVPLSYAPKERFITNLTSNPDLIRSVNTILPRMSFNLESLEYDVTRKQVSTLQNFAKNTTTPSTSLNTQFVPVPYNFDFSLSLYVRNTEDGTQILEQILPFFTPDFSVNVDFIPNMAQHYTVPIILNSVSSSNEYEGALKDNSTRMIFWDLTFTAKSYIWPPVKSGSYIRTANTNAHIDVADRALQKVFVDYANGTGSFQIGETIRDSANGFTGTVDFFSNTSSGTLVITGGSKVLSPGETLQGDLSGATYVISTIDVNSINVARIFTSTDPSTAEAEDNFGFSDIIVEYPDTLN